ncbi:MAG: carotenoid biosynthesis protein [Anaerolineae bacterium]|nr:carotenoid biosynthesis protein [Anaerolineae bacterium]
MIRAEYLIFELIVYALFIGCAWHAAHQSGSGRHRVMELGVALVYGVFLEWMTLRQLSAYHYGQFLIMIDDAPLAIGAGWAVIIYSAMIFSDRLQMPEMARPFLDGLLALNIDLAMDAVAIRLGMWTWGTGDLTYQWFGVPWGNFWAWFIVVTSYSFFVRWLRVWRTDRIRGWLYAPLAMVLSVAVLALTNSLFQSLLHPNNLGLVGMLVLIGSGLIIVIGVRPRVLQAGRPEPVIIAVPLAFHLYFFGAGIVFGFFAAQPILAVISGLMLVLGLGLHLWPWWVARRPSA